MLGMIGHVQTCPSVRSVGLSVCLSVCLFGIQCKLVGMDGCMHASMYMYICIYLH